MEGHQPHCRCGSCTSETTQKEKELHLALSENSRREFLKRASRLGLSLGLGGGLITPLASSCLQDKDSRDKSKAMQGSQAVKNGKATLVTLLHTADIHSQLSIHDEFFIEEGEVVYKKRGGIATLKTMVNQLRGENPESTMLIDGGDCFQGGGLAALTQGQAIVPMMNNIGYDLMLPGNWEVVYGKKMMMQDMFGYDAPKVCANMYHDTQDVCNGDLIFPPYFIKRIGNIKIGFIGYNDPLTATQIRTLQTYC